MRANKKNIYKILAFLSVLAMLGMFSGGNYPILGFLKGTEVEGFLYALHTGDEIIFNLSNGFIVSIFLWFLVVQLPELRKRKILRDNLTAQYQRFKEDIISIFLGTLYNSYNSNLPEELSDYQNFKEYFGGNNHAKWYDVLNGLERDEERLNDLLVELEFLANEIHYVLSNVDIDDNKIHSFFKRMLTYVYKLKNLSTYSEEQVKYLGNFLWGILAQWDFIDGQREEDIIQKMIDKI